MSQPRYTNLDELSAYKKLQQLKPALSTGAFLKACLDDQRVKKYECSYQLGQGNDGPERLSYNYAAKITDDAILSSLATLADEAGLITKYREVLNGKIMNPGENRMVLHHLSRGKCDGDVIDGTTDIYEFYEEQRSRIVEFSLDIHAAAIVSTCGRPFDTVVQVGIGGSDLGPRALFLAIKNYVEASEKKATRGRGQRMNAAFISNVDPDDAADVFRGINPETTMFILVSKSGTTQETLTNEALVIDFLRAAGVTMPRKHIVCVTSQTSPLAKSTEYLNSFFIDDFIGGRYSSTSAVGGVILSLAFGSDIFTELLEGAHAADLAALNPAPLQNPAMLDALLGLFERNILGYPMTAILPYSQALSRFPAHLQQLDMESNGKSVNRDGQSLNYQTGPVIFGEPGTNGQHSFFQLLHQGTDTIPLQFIGFLHAQDGTDVQFQGSSSQKKLNANLAAQIVAFALGKDDTNPNKRFSGGRPSSLLHAKRLSPRVLGALLAHYENKVMFQGFLWNVNSFDQEGVQLGKVLTGKVLDGNMSAPLTSYAKLLGI